MCNIIHVKVIKNSNYLLKNINYFLIKRDGESNLEALSICYTLNSMYLALLLNLIKEALSIWPR
jgi:hypothetical protein